MLSRCLLQKGLSSTRLTSSMSLALLSFILSRDLCNLCNGNNSLLLLFLLLSPSCISASLLRFLWWTLDVYSFPTSHPGVLWLVRRKFCFAFVVVPPFLCPTYLWPTWNTLFTGLVFHLGLLFSLLFNNSLSLRFSCSLIWVF